MTTSVEFAGRADLASLGERWKPHFMGLSGSPGSAGRFVAESIISGLWRFLLPLTLPLARRRIAPFGGATPPAAFFLCSRACDEYLSDGGLGGRLRVGDQCGCDARCAAQAERRGEAGVYRRAGERDSAA